MPEVLIALRTTVGRVGVLGVVLREVGGGLRRGSRPPAALPPGMTTRSSLAWYFLDCTRARREDEHGDAERDEKDPQPVLRNDAEVCRQIHEGS